MCIIGRSRAANAGGWGPDQICWIGRCEARGKVLLCAQGIEVRGRWWQGDTWLALTSDPGVKDWMKEQLVGWRSKILSTDEEQRALRQRIAALAPAILPKGDKPLTIDPRKISSYLGSSNGSWQ